MKTLGSASFRVGRILWKFKKKWQIVANLDEKLHQFPVKFFSIPLQSGIRPPSSFFHILPSHYQTISARESEEYRVFVRLSLLVRLSCSSLLPLRISPVEGDVYTVKRKTHKGCSIPTSIAGIELRRIHVSSVDPLSSAKLNADGQGEVLWNVSQSERPPTIPWNASLLIIFSKSAFKIFHTN